MVNFNENHTEVGGYPYIEINDVYYMPCTRCWGTGHYSFDGQSTVCYKCGDSDGARIGREIGDFAATLKHANKRAAAQQKRIADRNAKAAAEVEEHWAKVNATVPQDVIGYLKDKNYLNTKNAFIVSVAEQLQNVSNSRMLSERQIEAVRKYMAREAEESEKKANAEHLAEGRQTITGKVVKVNHYDSQYGLVVKMLVEIDGTHKVFGTVPETFRSQLDYDTDKLVGREVTFIAKVENTDDPTFARFTRPTKAAIKA